MVSGGREGSSLFKLSGSVHVEPTSGQQCWQSLSPHSTSKGCMEATAVTQHHCAGNWDCQVFSNKGGRVA